MKKLNFFTTLVCFIIVSSLAITSCTNKKKVEFVEVELNKFEKAALANDLYSRKDLALSKKLIAEEKVGKRETAQVSFLVDSSRISGTEKYQSGIYLKDNRSATYMRLFSSTGTLEYVKIDVLSRYSGHRKVDFDRYVFSEVSGYFCPNLPKQKFTVYKLKCSINNKTRYLSMVTTKIEGVDYYAVFYNYGRTVSEMGDTLALFLQTLKKKDV